MAINAHKTTTKYLSLFTKIDKAISLYQKGLTQVEVAKELNTTQRVIWRAFKNVGYKCRVAKKRNQTGKNNDSWKGNKAGYAALHYRVESLRGKPQECEVCGETKKQKYEWANLTGEYTNPNDYKRMCCSCHAKYDNKIKNITK